MRSGRPALIKQGGRRPIDAQFMLALLSFIYATVTLQGWPHSADYKPSLHHFSSGKGRDCCHLQLWLNHRLPSFLFCILKLSDLKHYKIVAASFKVIFAHMILWLFYSFKGVHACLLLYNQHHHQGPTV